MMKLLLNFFIILIISFVLLFLGVLLSMKMKEDREKLSPFECGFTPKFSARLFFSIRFFLVALIFLIFDVELILIFPFIPALTSSALFTSSILLYLIILILIVGLFHEIMVGSLSWAN
uniref:NADH-ubiquinone oxidoreductase chain 3 n=1 Tax=Phyllodiaptomus tunguidus TaxID=2690417 RepID=A0A8K1NVH9_9MAXI|nr:NADH dehydrogenase subunit 3 [Phyllodiaptomus tunguidus]